MKSLRQRLFPINLQLWHPHEKLLLAMICPFQIVAASFTYVILFVEFFQSSAKLLLLGNCSGQWWWIWKLIGCWDLANWKCLHRVLGKADERNENCRYCLFGWVHLFIFSSFRRAIFKGLTDLLWQRAGRRVRDEGEESGGILGDRSCHSRPLDPISLTCCLSGGPSFHSTQV